jgi:16S rRNA (guanine966-N2)-methyltransferase
MSRPRHSSRAKTKAAGQLRIIGGDWRSRRLPFADVPGLRPTTDRVRETVFNWLSGDLHQARCLDLFAGSAALGLEALSRGAASCLFIEKSGAAAEIIRQNLNTLNVDTRASLFHGDALQWLKHQAHKHGPFDLVFVDPPFQAALLPQCFELLQQTGILSQHAILYVEADGQQTLPALPPGWQLSHHKHTSQLQFGLIQCQSPAFETSEEESP